MVTGNARSRHSDQLIMVTDNSKHLLREAVTHQLNTMQLHACFPRGVEESHCNNNLTDNRLKSIRKRAGIWQLKCEFVVLF